MDGKRWDVDTALIDSWMFTLSRRERARMVAVISMLADFGPGLGRPHVGKIVSSRHSQMKELRVSGDFGRELRVLFCFAPDPRPFSSAGAISQANGARGSGKKFRSLTITLTTIWGGLDEQECSATGADGESGSLIRRG